MNKGPKLLIVEDDPTLQRVLKDNFEFSGYQVTVASDGHAGWQAAKETSPDLILLDIMLPKANGFDVCRRLRQEGVNAPIIMLTAKGQESDVVLGLNVGADDYVTKPFSIEVLLARVEACLRRQRKHDEAEDISTFGPFTLNRDSRKLFRDQEEIILTPKEFGVLDLFLNHTGRALTRDRILDAVWGEDLIVTQRSVDRCLNTLRKKIEQDANRPRWIITVRDLGYRFEQI